MVQTEFHTFVLIFKTPRIVSDMSPVKEAQSSSSWISIENGKLRLKVSEFSVKSVQECKYTHMHIFCLIENA